MCLIISLTFHLECQMSKLGITWVYSCVVSHRAPYLHLWLVNARFQLCRKAPHCSAVGTKKMPFSFLFSQNHQFSPFLPNVGNLSTCCIAFYIHLQVEKPWGVTERPLHWCIAWSPNTCWHDRVVCVCLPTPSIVYPLGCLLLLANPGPKSSSGLAIRGLILGKMSLLHLPPSPFFFPLHLYACRCAYWLLIFLRPLSHALPSANL